jgi:hypothetical protein
MRIGFTADLHLKLGQKSVPVDWAKNRYRALFVDIAAISDGCDIFIIGGDIFDKIPSVEELELYYELVASVQCKGIIYSGNHEALKKNTTFLTYLKGVTSKLNPLVEIIDDFATIEGIDFIPYNKLKEYHPGNIDFHSDILCTHVRGEILPHVKPEVNLSIFERWKVVLAGDLHSYENSQLNILYPGSPVTTSFHRNNVHTGIIVLDSETLEHKWIQLDLPQLIRKSVAVGDPMPAGTYDHIMYEVEGNMVELGALADSALVDKKIVNRNTDTALILEPEMSLEEEVCEYLRYILALDDPIVTEILEELAANAANLSR